MTTKDHDQDEESGADTAAAESVLGLLTDAEKAALLERAKRDPEVQKQIEIWEEQFASLADELEPVTPSGAVLSAVRESIGAEAAAKPARPAKARLRRTLWDDVAFWRGLAFASTAAAAALSFALVFVNIPGEEPPDLPELVASLVSTQGPAMFVATYKPSAKQMIMVPASSVTEPGRVPELWLVPKGLKAISLGVLDPSKPQVMVLPGNLAELTAAGAALVITLEPPGGAPEGVATGPAVAKGDLSSI